MDGIKNGFYIVKPGSVPTKSYCANHKSALNVLNRVKVENQIVHELRNNRYVVCHQKPMVISALGAVPKAESEDIRLIHDCSRPHGSSVNDYANPDSFSFNTVDAACRHID